jgi:hypothetical protein
MDAVPRRQLVPAISAVRLGSLFANSGAEAVPDLVAPDCCGKRKPRLLVPGLPRRCLERPGIKVPWTPRYYLKAQITQGADRDSSLLAKRHLPALPCPKASPKTYRLDNGHCAGAAKNSGEEKVIAIQRKTKTKACEQGKCDQLPQAWRHFHTGSDSNRVKGAPRPAAGSDGQGLGHDATGKGAS